MEIICYAAYQIPLHLQCWYASKSYPRITHIPNNILSKAHRWNPLHISGRHIALGVLFECFTVLIKRYAPTGAVIYSIRCLPESNSLASHHGCNAPRRCWWGNRVFALYLQRRTIMNMLRLSAEIFRILINASAPSGIIDSSKWVL